MASRDFYRELARFPDFNELTDDRNFRPLPADWTLVVADIENSTGFVEEGRYRDVNTVGAAAIVAAQNAMGGEEFPYVFGGDGATLAVPPGCVDKVGDALDGVRSLALRNYGMTLRVGVIPASELYAMGQRIELAKFELIAGKSIAIFRGGGLTKADELIKTDLARYALKERPEHASDLSGLSCRWKAIPSVKGKMLTLLVKASSAEDKTAYETVLRGLDGILDGSCRNANPVRLPPLTYRAALEIVRAERKLHASPFALAFLLRTAEILAAVLIFKWRIPQPAFDADRYARSMRDHSDFRKFDDVLRMVVDCTAPQAEKIRALFETLRGAGRITYGLHESDQALMTCFVQGLDDGEHIHFVDGGGGGYAMAAKALKAQAK